MRGYESHPNHLWQIDARLRIPMRGYESAITVATSNCRSSYESPCGVMSDSPPYTYSKYAALRIPMRGYETIGLE